MSDNKKKTVVVPQGFVDAVREMMKLQAQYFRERRQSTLIEAKQKENIVRQYLRSFEKGQEPVVQMTLIEASDGQASITNQ